MEKGVPVQLYPKLASTFSHSLANQKVSQDCVNNNIKSAKDMK